MTLDRWSDTVELLACDIGARPPAPGPDDLAPFVVAVNREADAIVVRYRPEGEALFASFASAESICCSSLTWDTQFSGILRIGGTVAQLNALQELFPGL